MKERRGPWYLLTGFVLGILVGLAYAWVVAPVEYQETSPASLRADFKDRYRALIALAYAANGDLTRAQARLNLLGEADVARILAEQAQRTLAEGKSPQEAQTLGLLALALGQGLPTANTAASSVQFTPSLSPVGTLPSSLPFATSIASPQTTASPPSGNIPITPTEMLQKTSPVVSTAFPTGTPLPTRTPTPTPAAPFILLERTFICDQNLSAPLIQVIAKDGEGQEVPGVEFIVSWEGGEEHFFSGLKPELGLGYADFSMTPGVTYTLHLMDGGQPISDLTAAECESESGSRFWGSWLLVFAQP